MRVEAYFIPTICVFSYLLISKIHIYNGYCKTARRNMGTIAFFDIMGSSLSTSNERFKELSAQSGLSISSIKMLNDRFLTLATHQDKTLKEPFMTVSDFESIPELLKNPLGPRLIDAFFAVADAEQQKRVYFADFVRVISHFRPIDKNVHHPWNSREAKLKFAFTMYDLNKSGTITKDEFTEILKKMIGDNVSAAKVDSIAERTMRETDGDSDGSITFQEFCKAMEKTDIEQKMSFRFLT
uniref:EF-hand domain-containing protein n=1 Tax=Panagrellus redivivus TaxID=6233 RepID=A0A7E4UNB0_PANRE